ncbi:MAG TPA: imidazolonepropionase [Phycisphaerae bacterium]|nr:imidazolonepropionase [Phycisphaerae bacterium]HRW51755.1 imidazolonepropionase [Phycisphaerae bacterium]
MKTRIENIAQLVAVPPGPVCGDTMRRPPIIEDAALIIEDERIAWFGVRKETPASADADVIDARGGTLTPGLIDCHTHVVYAGSRENEFEQRIAGASYIEILEAGGGIRNSVRMLRAASEDDLVAQSLPRVRHMLEYGVTTIEAKSGYGLAPEHELKTLRAIRRVASQTPVEMIGTYLAAHTIPPEFDGRADAYLDQMLDPALLKQVVDEGLAEFADVFCERGAFNLEQSRRFLTACRSAGLAPKIHSEQITWTGATAMACGLGAVSADHLECVTDEDIAALKASKTIPVVLPGCSFFLGSPVAPARKLIEAGLPVALATDVNPGSCTIESLPLIMSMAATMLRMTPLESLVACTANAAAALRRADRLGAIAIGHQADLVILETPNVNRWAYNVGVNPVAKVIKAGRVVVDRTR